MIEVCWHRDHYRLTVTGHAGSAEVGKDLVCAGASTLAMTLAVNVEVLDKIGALWEKTIRLDKGDAEIQCKPKAKYRSVTGLTMEMFFLGFDALAAQYPEYIRVEVMG